MYGFSYRIKEVFSAIGGFFSRIGRMFSFVDGLYSNVGDKLCAIAKICGVIGVIAFIVGVVFVPLTIITGDDAFIILAAAFAGSGIGVLVSSWPLYAFGQVVRDVHAIRNK